MRRLLPVLLIVLLLLSSCELEDEAFNKGRKYIVAVGLDYKSNPRIQPLENTENDQKAVLAQLEALCLLEKSEYTLLSYHDYDSREGDPIFTFEYRNSEGESDSWLLEYEQEEPERIREAFLEEISNALERDGRPGKDDKIILYFACHADQDTGPAIFHSVKDGVPGYTSISYVDLKRNLLEKYESRGLMILDVCYSGWALEEGELEGASGERKDDQAMVDTRDSLVQQLGKAFTAATSTSRPILKDYAITASSRNQKSYDSDIYSNEEGSERHGAFSFALLKALGYDTVKDQPSIPLDWTGRYISLYNLYDRVVGNMSEEIRRISHPGITRTRLDPVIFNFR